MGSIPGMPATAVRHDVHQHLWPEPFVTALGRRRGAPCVRPDGRGWIIQVPGERDSPFTAATHDAEQRARSLKASGLDVALLCTSTPLGIEALPEDEARPLLDAWHAGVREIAGPFAFWGAVPLHGARPDDVDRLLDAGAVGLSVPASALAGPSALERLG